MLEDGSHQEDLWGADGYPDARKVEFGALINIRPSHGNYALEIEDVEIRKKVEKIIRNLLELESK